jgi:NAD(P)-dependent dehydrogenase (short-subunit alcohol dehydrogenase family)
MHKNILITGVSRGLGRALVQPFIELGHTVVGCARSTDSVQQLSESFESPNQFDVVDISSDQSVEAWSKRVIEKIGPPDLILNNAGLINANNSLWEVPPEEFDRVIDVNLKGSFYVIRHFVPAMIDAGQGVIVNFSSGWGRSTSPDVGPYCTTKWGVEGMTGSLAQELPAGLAAVALNPGIINTEMLQTCFGEGASQYPAAEQWAKTAAPFLLELTSANNGQALTAP